MRILYCILHGMMEKVEEAPILGHIYEVETNSRDGRCREIEFCEFEGGWATVPEPPYDLEGYIETHGQPPSPLSEDLEEAFPLWILDNTDHMVMEERVQ